jgi:L-asparagine transporter-like permease
MLTGLGSIIGSGWLFGAWKAAKIAGPAALCAWVIGAVVILAIALTYAEPGAMFPESGGMVRYARYSHGALVGFISAWANWITRCRRCSAPCIRCTAYRVRQCGSTCSYRSSSCSSSVAGVRWRPSFRWRR